MIPIMPTSETWTAAQWQAIWERDADILVSAAAGSGKTAVLIRRLIERITDQHQPIGVDELLVVTFTNAAAAEMRHRLAEAIEKAIQLNPESKHLRQQLHLLNKANISTLHSFCLQIIRQYGYLLDIDPGFRLANENESALLQEDALEEIIEEAYEADQDAMYRLADSFSSDRSDQALEHLIRQLYHYARVHPNPHEWLEAIVEAYSLQEDMTVDDLPYTVGVKQAILYRVQTARAQNTLLKSLAESSSGLEALVTTALVDEDILHVAEEKVQTATWDDLYAFFSQFKWATAKAVRGDYDEDLKQQLQSIRNQYKADITAIKDDYFARRPERLLDEIRMMHPVIQTLVNRVEEFAARYEEKKSQRSLLDFSDLEHKAYAILVQPDRHQPSEVALSYRRKFKEVLVDEYQDINLLQEGIIQLVKSGGEADGNMFMVGDVKQSIYRFRLAEPMLFLNKYERFKATTTSGTAIDLNANFRSRKEVVDGINYIFEQIMGKDVGEITYDEEASLKQGAPYNDVLQPIEVHIFQKGAEQEEELTKARAEAEWTARKIKELIDTEKEVYDPWTKATRKAQYRDCVILMRSMTWTPEFIEVFKQYKIPFHVETKTGFYEAIEIQWMLELLKIIDNPYQDIPLVAVLRSPMIGMTDEELAQLRAVDKKCPFYDLLQNSHAQASLSSKMQSKIQQFLVLHQAWQKKSQSGPLVDIIWSIYQDTYLLEQVATMPAGSQRQSNLHMLLDQAEQFEQTSYRGVFRFLRFIERIRNRGDDVGEARAISDRENVVRILTIHASKGLEFPFVFLPGMARGFNQMDFKENYLFDQHDGIAVKAIDPELRIAYHSLPFIALKERKLLEAKSEEMRILYVAMTRAREKLFMTLSVTSVDSAIDKWVSVGFAQSDEPVPPFIRSNANSYWEWLGPAWLRLPDFQQLVGIQTSSLKPLPGNWSFELHTMASEMEEQDFTGEENSSDTITSQTNHQLKEQFDATYAYELAIKKTAKQTVSELKRLQTYEASEEDYFAVSTLQVSDDEWEIPSFMNQEKSFSATTRGTVYHSVFQHLPLDKSFNVDAYLNTLVEREIITTNEKTLIDLQHIEAFLKSSLKEELDAAKQIYREQPFTFAMKDERGDYQIVQGVIDLFFEDQSGQWHLLDFKTDALSAYRKKPEQAFAKLKERYAVQMNLYAQALEEILAIKLASRLIYSVPYHQTIKM